MKPVSAMIIGLGLRVTFLSARRMKVILWLVMEEEIALVPANVPAVQVITVHFVRSKVG